MSEESRKFIKLAIEVLERENVTQDLVDMAVNYIKQAIEQIKTEEKPAEVVSNYTGIAISNDDKKIYLGLPISLNATVFPYDIYGENKYIVTSSDTSIVGADEEYITKGLSDYPHILIPKKCGKVTITASTVDKKFSDSITMEVREIPVKTFKGEEIYCINNNDWNIVKGQLNTLEEARKTFYG